MSEPGSFYPHVHDLRGVVHEVLIRPAPSGTEVVGSTRCGRYFTHGKQYARPWPHNIIVEHMDTTNTAVNCVPCTCGIMVFP